jgi:hypothetical protein
MLAAPYDRFVHRLVLLVGALAIAVPAAGAIPNPLFRTPSRNIY